jgi:putative membrane protein (TIGR04086 family)
MTQTRAAAHRKHTHRNTKGVGRLLRGLGVSILTTLVGVALFSLLMQWVKPSDGAIRVFNQLLKLLSIALGVWSAVGRGGEKGLMRGAAVGFGYMGLGVALYAILSGQQAAFSSYLADLAMGVAGGGIVGMILSNISAK